MRYCLIPVPQQYRQTPTDLTYLGLGPMLSYDPRALLAGGVIVLTPEAQGADDRGLDFAFDLDAILLDLIGDLAVIVIAPSRRCRSNIARRRPT
jgi:hypothetical protein